MKFIYTLTLVLFFSITSQSFSQETNWIKTEGEIIEISIKRSRKTKEFAIIKFKLEDGTEQLGSAELFRVPFIGSMKSVGDQITIHYDQSNPAIVKTVIGSFLSQYGLYILIFLGVIYSIKSFLNKRKHS